MFLDDMGILKLYWKITAGWMKKIISHFWLSNILEGYCTTDTKYPQVLLLDIFPAHYIGRVNFEAFKKKKCGENFNFYCQVKTTKSTGTIDFWFSIDFCYELSRKNKTYEKNKTRAPVSLVIFCHTICSKCQIAIWLMQSKWAKFELLANYLKMVL